MKKQICRTLYEAPMAELIRLGAEDIISTSKDIDDGEWDVNSIGEGI